MRKLLVVWCLVVAGAVVDIAAQFDMAAIQKWQAVKVVHYQVVGVFRAATPVSAGSGASSYGFVEASDRVTLDFDWDVKSNAIVGKAAFTNAPSQVISANSGSAECPPPAVKGTYEHFELTAIEPQRDTLALKGTRSYPAAGISAEWPATCKQRMYQPSKAEVTEVIAVTSPMLLLMPSGANPNLVVSADKKSFTIKHKGWSWTYTPSIVK